MNGIGAYTKSWVIKIIIINVVVFFIEIFIMMTTTANQAMMPFGGPITMYFGLTPALIVEKYYYWQFFTYMFVHGGLLHILFNMYFLLFLGIPIENTWGSKKFVFFYLFTGIGAGITIFIVNYLMGDASYITPTVGASGAIYGVLVAFGFLFPDVELFILFIPVPIRAKYMVLIMGAMNIIPLITSGGQSSISWSGHLGGILFGFLYFLITRKRGISFKSKIIKARLHKEIDRRNATLINKDSDKKDMLSAIYHKIKEAGPDSITDDEYQYVRHMEIMLQDVNSLCPESDFDSSDDYCAKCSDAEACYLREIKKSLS